MMKKTILLLGIVITLSIAITSGPVQAVNTIPDIQTHSVEGIQVNFRPPEGEYLFIMCWDTSSWSAGQMAEWGLDLNTAFHDRGLNIIGICTDTIEEEILEFSEMWGLPWPQVPNSENGTAPLTEQFALGQTPDNVLIDSKGNVIARNLKLSEAQTAVADILGIEHYEPKPLPEESPKRAWGPEQAAGKPDTREAGDFSTAWASLTPDDGEEYLILRYEDPIEAASVKIYETFNPGAVCQVSAFTSDGLEKKIWSGSDPVKVDDGIGISEIPVEFDGKISQIKLYLNSKEHPGFNQIDAVGLMDTSGNTHWATNAEASSTIAQNIQFDTGFSGFVYPSERALTSFSQLRDTGKAMSELRQAVYVKDSEPSESFRYHIKAFVEGASVLVIHRNTARWYHVDEVVKGFEPESHFPTYINGREWYPEWTDENCVWSSIETGINPPLPATAMRVELKDPRVSATNCQCELNDKTEGFDSIIGQAPKGAFYILQHPSEENDYVLAIVFDDFAPSGSNIFDCFINVRVGESKQLAGGQSKQVLMR